MKKKLTLLLAALTMCSAVPTFAAGINKGSTFTSDTRNNNSFSTASYAELTINHSQSSAYIYDNIRVSGYCNPTSDPSDYFKIKIYSPLDQNLLTKIRFDNKDNAAYELTVYDANNLLRGQLPIEPNSIAFLSNIFTQTNQDMYFKVQVTNNVQPETAYAFRYGDADILGYSIDQTISTTTTSALHLDNNSFDKDTIEYSTNENGETYGYGCYEEELGELPDLIKAVGVGQTIGYVKATDLSTGEATIPLYANDGQTILGEFELNANVESKPN